ncbi:hypothetical protein [Vibrio casei]|uniref:hypothetical protein n=1 Tax=Vibrio casei TaxID=673372 RepID=UPI003F9925F2
MEITQEQFESVPDFLKDQYEKQESGSYVSVDSLKVGSLKKSLDDLDSKYKGELSQLNEKLTGIEKSKADEIEAAKAKALEEARTKGDVTAIEERYKQEMADLEKRVSERVRGEVESEYTAKQAASKAESMRKMIAKDLGIDENAASTIEFMLAPLLKPNESNQISLYDVSGSATSVNGEDEEAIKSELRKLPQFKHLVADNSGTQRNNGILNGAGKTVSNTQTNAAAQEAIKNRDGIGHLNAIFKEAFKK